ncbi:hypothetical protein [Streptomyces flaveus]|uniref:hypothetical protein n=1 Tax=Streptomyces flaveus TaxID=66370 RepID=UPI00167053F5|nr:hypothetical protein [Streptomyces flaveus]
MHRSTTTATLLVTVAVSAVSGCVTVQHPPSPGVPAPSSRPSTPHPEVRSDPRLVQAPAQEALERVGPPRRPSPPVATPSPTAPPSPPATARRPSTDAPRNSDPQRPEQPSTPRGVPHVPARPRPADPGVCDLGRKYGRWQPDSPEATICQETYGS